MLPEKGGTNAFTLLVVNRLTDLGGPVTVDELVDALYNGAGVHWNYVGQQYQRKLASHRRDSGAADVPAAPHEPGAAAAAAAPRVGYDPVHGWHHPDYDPEDPRDRRIALRTVVQDRLQAQRRWAKGEGWALRIEEPGEPVRWVRNPDYHPKVVTNGKAIEWTPDAREEVEAVRSEAVRAINQGAIERQFRQLTLNQQATTLRYLAELLPSCTKSEAMKLSRSGFLKALAKETDGDPDKVLELLHRLTTPPE